MGMGMGMGMSMGGMGMGMGVGINDGNGFGGMNQMQSLMGNQQNMMGGGGGRGGDGLTDMNMGNCIGGDRNTTGPSNESRQNSYQHQQRGQQSRQDESGLEPGRLSRLKDEIAQREREVQSLMAAASGGDMKRKMGDDGGEGVGSAKRSKREEIF
mmetsp:Transcript_21866/g.44261  ORF Transcript_21866/g.44261 Transcript_21866/m.44261 type:complete len:155 (-) Transcript_21866:91-555(-)